jgi:anti-sigma factor RsiW
MPPRPLSCPEIVELSTDYLEDALDASVREAVELHLNVCDGCRAYISQQRAIPRLLHYHLRRKPSAAERLRAREAFRAWKRQRCTAGTSG